MIIILFSNFKQIHIQTLCQFAGCRLNKKANHQNISKAVSYLIPLVFKNPLQINFEDWRKTYEEKIYEASD